MSKSVTILTRTEPEVKQAADHLFEEIGISTSGAINIFLRRAVKAGGFPFKVTIDEPNIPDFDTMTSEERDQLVKDAIDDFQKNGAIPAEKVFAELDKKYAIA